MEASAEAQFEDGTPVRFLLTPVQGAMPDQGGAVPDPGGDEDRPEGMGKAIPVATGRGAVATFAVGTLRAALRPLGPLLQEVHDAVTAAPEPPSEMSVTFGVQVGQDLKFGIVGGNGQAHLTVTASWRPTAATDSGAAPGAE
ncbi:CU044_2847 family protein [Streptomyces sp. NPDC001530]|uniref:CU044_2847 family protein n=1 Tax=Streptomyces sp. NPDC001530 TaxID=3364582 RepID=UPI0036CA5F77